MKLIMLSKLNGTGFINLTFISSIKVYNSYMMVLNSSLASIFMDKLMNCFRVKNPVVEINL
jgi:hypothetical protein